MANPRASVTLGGSVVLVADIEQYKPFSDAALGVTVFEGIEAVTVQDFGFRASRQNGSLSSGTGTSPGLLSAAALAALEALVGAWGAAQPLTDSLGNAGTVKVTAFGSGFAYGVPGAQVSLWSYTLAWRWLTLATRYGVPYTGRP